MEALKEAMEARRRFKYQLIERVVSRYLGDEVVSEIKEAKAFTVVAQGIMAMNQLEFNHIHRQHDGAEWFDVIVAGKVIETVPLEGPRQGFAP